jgi:hypothetical protein
MVESREEEGAGGGGGAVHAEPPQPERPQPEHVAPQAPRRGGHRPGPAGSVSRPETIERYLSPTAAGEGPDPRMLDDDDEDSMPASPMSMQDGIRAVQQAFTNASPAPRWPMYVRQAKQFLKTGIEGFDERKYGFASVVDLLRAAGKEGVLRLERDRHGAVRVFPGSKLAVASASAGGEAPVEVTGEILAGDGSETEVTGVTRSMSETVAAEPVDEPPIVDAETIEEPSIADAEATPARKGARKRKAAAPRAKVARAEKAGKPVKPRARKTSRVKSEAADHE